MRASIAPGGRCAPGRASRLGRGDWHRATTERPALVQTLRRCMKEVGFKLRPIEDLLGRYPELKEGVTT